MKRSVELQSTTNPQFQLLPIEGTLEWDSEAAVFGNDSYEVVLEVKELTEGIGFVKIKSKEYNYLFLYE